VDRGGFERALGVVNEIGVVGRLPGLGIGDLRLQRPIAPDIAVGGGRAALIAAVLRGRGGTAGHRPEQVLAGRGGVSVAGGGDPGPVIARGRGRIKR
jgi:hypothetical protein